MDKTRMGEGNVDLRDGFKFKLGGFKQPISRRKISIIETCMMVATKWSPKSNENLSL